MNIIIRFTALTVLAASLWSTASNATIFTYTDEAQYLDKLSSLAHGQWSETFEGGVWDGLQTTVDSGGRTYHVAPTATSQGITWRGPSDKSPITTQRRFRPLPGESNAEASANAWSLTAVTRRNGDVDAFAGSSADKLYGVGGWFDALSGYKLKDDVIEVPKGHMFVSIDGGLYDDFGAGGDSDPYNLINGIGYFNSTSDRVPRFFGIVDTAGFNSFNFSSDQGVGQETGGAPGESSEPGYSGPIVYADNFTFGGTTTPVPELSTWATMMTGLMLLGLRLRRRVP